MATSRLPYDQASERLLDWYLNMSVEYLSNDELKHELESRSVVLDKKLDLTRKRKLLKEKLKTEKQSEVKFFVGVVIGDAKDEAEVCLQKYSFLKNALEKAMSKEEKCIYYARLVHVGARVAVLLSSSRDSPNLHSHLQNLLVELVELLEPVQETLTIIEERTELETESLVQTGQDLILVGPSNVARDAQGTTEKVENIPLRPRDSMLSQEDVAWIHSLQKRILGLEKELAKRKGIDVGTQTSYEHLGATITEQQIVLNPFSASNSDKTFPMHSPLPNILNSLPKTKQNPSDSSNSNLGDSNSFPNPAYTTHNPSHQPHPVMNSNPRASLNPQSFLQPNPIPNPIPDPFPQRNPNEIPQVNHPFPVQQYRHTLPVSKWSIARYGGDDQGLKLNEFLEHVQALAQAEHVSEQMLFESAIHLFTGSALKWYMTQRATGRLLNWEHLVFELRRTFMHPDLDALIKIKIYQRRQQKSESFYEFYFELEKMFRTMSRQIPNVEKMQIIQQNMRLDYKRQMTFLPITDLETLIAAGQKLDALNFSAYNKVFGLDNTVHAVQNAGNLGSRRKPKKAVQTMSSLPEHSVSIYNQQQSNQVRNNRSMPMTLPNPQPNTNIPPTSRYPENPRKLELYPRKDNSRPPGPSTSHNKPKLTLAELVNNHAPPPPNTCLNCNRFGHHEAMCRLPREIFCSTCGLHGFPTNLCPYCLKNNQGADESRRSQNPSA